MTKFKLGFLGFGQMAEALSAGILEKSIVNASKIAFVEIEDARAQLAEDRYQLTRFAQVSDLLKNCEFVILAVKPFQIKEALTHCDTIKTKIISILAGSTIKNLSIFLKSAQIMRAMPNTPVKLAAGMTGLYFPKNFSAQDQKFVERLFNAVGKTLKLKSESKMDVLTAVSGSGPAFFYYLIKIFEKKAQKLGFSKAEARLLVQSTQYGATLMLEKYQDPDHLIKQVSSKKGTTLAGLAQLKNSDLENIIEATLVAAKTRAEEIARGE